MKKGQIIDVEELLKNSSNPTSHSTTQPVQSTNQTVDQLSNQKPSNLKSGGIENGSNMELPPFLADLLGKLQGKKMQLMIATPCYGGLCYVDYVIRLVQTQNLLAQFGVPVVIEFMKNESLITRARNNLTAKFLNNKDNTHLLFIDADIVWNPIDVLKLLAHDKEVSGGIYPKKRYDWSKLSEDNLKEYKSRKNLFYNKDKTEEDLIKENLVMYNLNYDRSKMRIENNLLEIYTLATGFMMIKRNVFEDMIKKFPERKYIDDTGYLTEKESEMAYDLFRCEIVNGRSYMSEDWMFCHIWREMGGNIYCDLSIALSHIGNETYNGRILSSLVIN